MVGRNVESYEGPVFPVQCFAVVGGLVPSAGGVAGDEVGVAAGGVNLVVVLVKKFEHEAGLLISVVTAWVLQYCSIFQQ